MTVDEFIAAHLDPDRVLYQSDEVEHFIRKAWRLAHHAGATEPQPTIEELLATDDDGKPWPEENERYFAKTRRSHHGPEFQ